MKRTLTYTLVGLLSPVITLLLLPVYLKYFSTSEYVIISLSNSFIAVFSIFFGDVRSFIFLNFITVSAVITEQVLLNLSCL